VDSAERIKVICVDDEPSVLTLLTHLLGRRYEVLTAEGGASALETLKLDPTIAVIVSDLRMPGMDGVMFLNFSRQVAPDAVRVLLTGNADVKAAIAAVNDGQIFRFLTKPCANATLVATIGAAVDQNRLITAERVLLEQTLHGCVKALTDVLAIANPMSFGRALRIKQHVTDLADQINLTDRWQIEVAAMFSQLGLITLPPETAEKVQSGRELSTQEIEMVAKMPVVVEQLLANIPRLEEVREMLHWSRRSFRPIDSSVGPRDAAVRRGGQILRIATDFDVLDARGVSAIDAVGMMRGRSGTYDPDMLTAMNSAHASTGNRTKIQAIRISALRVAMVFAEDVRLESGTLLVPRGYEVTERFIDRVSNFSVGSIKEPLQVIMPALAAELELR
jgi:CheY-like chemotaxis protein